MARTTIARDLIELIKLGKADKEEVLRHLADASSGAEQLRSGDPAVTVEFHKLRTQEPQLANAAGRNDLARGTAARPQIRMAPRYDVVVRMPLYRLTDADRVDVLRFGRHPDQDVQLLDGVVSREHGLVIFADKLPLFCDYGTLKGGVHAGSTNGTHLDGITPIRDAMIPWLPGQSLMLGQGPSFAPNGDPYYAFKVTYRLHALERGLDDPALN